MGDETKRVFNCDLRGCSYSTDDVDVAQSMVVMQVMIPASTGLTPIDGRYCSKAHAAQAVRELPEPPMILNPAAVEEPDA